VALGREAVELLASELPAGGDELGTDALRNEPVGVTGRDSRAERVPPSDLAADRDAAHRLDAGGDDHVVGAALHALGGERNRLLAATASAVDRDGGNGFRQSGREDGRSRRVEALLADLADRAADDVVDQFGIYPTRSMRARMA